MEQASLSTSGDVPGPCTCTTVRRTARVLARVYSAVLQDAELNATQLAVLRAIQRHEGEPLSRVAEDLCMDRTSLYRAAAKMQQDGWIAIGPGPDARTRTARIKPKGDTRLRAAAPAWSKTQTAIVEQFGRRRWAELVGELQRLAGIAEGIAPVGE